jgi:hypothetical protein
VQDVYEAIARKLPTGPRISGQEASKDKDPEPFSFIRGEDGKFTVFIPSDLESFVDDELVKSAVAAAKSLQASIAATPAKIGTLASRDSKVNAYLWGVQWALSDKKSRLLKQTDVSGGMGHGFYTVAHLALQETTGSTFWAKGSPWTFTKGLTGKAWDNTLSITERRVIALLTTASKRLSILDNWSSYFRSKDSFLGREVKKSLPHRREGILRKTEIEYLEDRHSAGIKEYNELLDFLTAPTLSGIKGLNDHIKKVGHGLASLSITVDSVVSHRATYIFSKDKKTHKLQKKTPIGDLISAMGWSSYIPAFDPLIFDGQKAFQVGEDIHEAEEKPELLEKYATQYKKRVAAINRTNKKLAGLAESFCAECFGA